MRRTTRRTSLALLSVLPLCLSACTSIPSDTPPNVIRSYASDDDQTNIAGPADGEASDVVLRGFFSASAHPLRGHQAARAFLTPGASKKWEDTTTAIIVDRLDINSDGAAEANHVKYQVRGNVIGVIGTGGTYLPQNSAYDSRIEMERVNGQWRISSLPQGVVIERTDFMNAYRPHELYFLDPSNKFLVPDRRWIYARQESMGSSLLSLLAQGPSREIAEGVHSSLPPDVTVNLTGERGPVTIELGRVSGLNSDDRIHVAAQIIWTLARAEVRGPYNIVADGAPLSDRIESTWSTQDVAAYEPDAVSSTALMAIQNGSLVTVKDSGVVPVSGSFGAINNLESAAVTIKGNVIAGVSVEGPERDRLSSLWIGAEGQPARKMGEATTFSRPSWAGDASTLWTVMDGKKILRISRTPTTGDTRQVEVDIRSLQDILKDDARISVFSIAHDGVRAAMIVGGSVYMASVAPAENGGWKLVHPIPIAYSIGDAALTLDWQVDGSLIVGTSARAAPVWRIEPDGSTVSQMVSRNVQAPVVAVASSPSTGYITDAHSILQLSTGAGDNQYWREVPALQGTRAVPVIPQ